MQSEHLDVIEHYLENRLKERQIHSQRDQLQKQSQELGKQLTALQKLSNELAANACKVLQRGEAITVSRGGESWVISCDTSTVDTPHLSIYRIPTPAELAARTQPTDIAAPAPEPEEGEWQPGEDDIVLMCKYCGERWGIPGETPMDEINAANRRFEQQHQACAGTRPVEEGSDV